MSEQTTEAVETAPVEAPQTEESTEQVEVASEENQESAESTQDAVEEAKQELENQLKKFSLKVDGEEVEEEVDLADEQALIQKLQLAKVAQKRMQEAAGLKKEMAQTQQDIQDFLEALKHDPVTLLTSEELGFDAKAFAQAIMNKELEEAQKSPEQREKEALEAKLQKLQQEVQKREQEARDSQRREMEERVANELEQEIMTEIKAHNLPQDPETLSTIAKYLKAGMKYKVNLSVKEVAPLVKKELYENAKRTLNSLSDDELADFVGKDRINNIRQNMIKQIKELKKNEPTKKIKDSGGDTVKDVDPFAKKSKGKIKQKEFFKNLGKQYR